MASDLWNRLKALRKTVLISAILIAVGKLADLFFTYTFGYLHDKRYWSQSEHNQILVTYVFRYGYWPGGIFVSLPIFVVAAAIPFLLVCLRLKSLKLTRATMILVSLGSFAIQVLGGLTWAT